MILNYDRCEKASARQKSLYRGKFIVTTYEFGIEGESWLRFERTFVFISYYCYKLYKKSEVKNSAAANIRQLWKMYSNGFFSLLIE